MHIGGYLRGQVALSRMKGWGAGGDKLRWWKVDVFGRMKGWGTKAGGSG